MTYPQQGQQGQQAQYAAQQQNYPAQQAQRQPAGAGVNMKRRNVVAVWLGLPMITLGIYSIVWFYKVHDELAQYDRRIPNKATNALLSLLFGAITLFIWPLIVYIKLAGHIRQAQHAAGLQPSCSTGLAVLLGLFGFGTLYYQLELNKVIDRYGDAAAGQQVPLAA